MKVQTGPDLGRRLASSECMVGVIGLGYVGLPLAVAFAEAGTAVGDVCRQLGVSEATFYTWKKKYAHLGCPDSGWC